MALAIWNTTNSTFTKSVAKLTDMGFTTKYRRQGNRKNIIVVLSKKGKGFYQSLSEHTTDWIGELSDLVKEKPERMQYYNELLQFFIQWMDVAKVDGVSIPPEGDVLIPLDEE